MVVTNRISTWPDNPFPCRKYFLWQTNAGADPRADAPPIPISKLIFVFPVTFWAFAHSIPY